jgi:hypothetical protein
LADGRRKKNGREGKVGRQVWRRDKATVEEVERIGSALELGRRVENLQQEVARMAVERRAAEHRNRGAPEEEEKGNSPRTCFNFRK